MLFHVSSFNDRWQVITEANMDLLRRFEAHGIRLAGPMHVNVTAPASERSWPSPLAAPADGADNKLPQ